MSVTLKYPWERVEAPKEYRGRPVIDPEKCLGCSACARACPPDAILIIDDFEKGVRRVVLDVSRCIRCARCEEVCPVGAMKLTQEFELATPNKEDLVQVVELRLAKCAKCGSYCDFTERQVKRALALAVFPGKEVGYELFKEYVPLCRKCRVEGVIKTIAESGGVVE